MARTTEADVQAVLGRRYISGDSLTVFIDAASLLIDRVAACGIAKGTPYTDADLQTLETYVAADLYVGSGDEGIYKSKQTGKASATFRDTSSWWTTALRLDSIGCLQELTIRRVKASGFWMGRRPSEQTDYVDRD